MELSNVASRINIAQRPRARTPLVRRSACGVSRGCPGRLFRRVGSDTRRALIGVITHLNAAYSRKPSGRRALFPSGARRASVSAAGRAITPRGERAPLGRRPHCGHLPAGPGSTRGSLGVNKRRDVDARGRCMHGGAALIVRSAARPRRTELRASSARLRTCAGLLHPVRGRWFRGMGLRGSCSVISG